MQWFYVADQSNCRKILCIVSFILVLNNYTCKLSIFVYMICCRIIPDSVNPIWKRGIAITVESAYKRRSRKCLQNYFSIPRSWHKFTFPCWRAVNHPINQLLLLEPCNSLSCKCRVYLDTFVGNLRWYRYQASKSMQPFQEHSSIEGCWI